MDVKMTIFVASLAIGSPVFADTCTVCGSNLDQDWVECQGSAEKRDKAILEALKEGVSQVFGMVLNGKVQVASASASATSMENETRSRSSASSESFSEELAAETGGMVKKWKLVSEVNEDGLVKVHVHAKVINPRKDNVRTVMLMPVKVPQGLGSSNIKMEKGRIVSGKDIGKVVGETLCSCLSGQSTFEIRTPEELDKALDITKIDALLVKNGTASSTELQEMGQLLTTDYLLSVVLKDVRYTHRMVFKGGKASYNDRFAITLHVTMTNVKSGCVAGSSSVTAELRNKDIVKLRAKDEDVKLLDAALGLLYFPLMQWTSDLVTN